MKIAIQKLASKLEGDWHAFPRGEIMKVSLLMGLMILALLGCGKDKSKSSSADQTNPYIGVVPPTSQEAYNTILSWYNAIDSSGAYGKVSVRKLVYTCNTKTKWDFISWTSCDNDTVYEDVYVIQNAVRSSYQHLKPAFNPPVGAQLAGVMTVSYNRYRITYLKANGTYLEYELDLSRHAAYNPVVERDEELNRAKYVQLPY